MARSLAKSTQFTARVCRPWQHQLQHTKANGSCQKRRALSMPPRTHRSWSLLRTSAGFRFGRAGSAGRCSPPLRAGRLHRKDSSANIATYTGPGSRGINYDRSRQLCFSVVANGDGLLAVCTTVVVTDANSALALYRTTIHGHDRRLEHA